MELSRHQLLEVVQTCMPATGKSASLIEGAENIVFDGEYAHTYNDLVSVSVPFTASGLVGAVRAAELAKLLAKLTTETIHLEVDLEANVWRIQAGRVKSEFSLIDTSGAFQHLNVLANESLVWSPVPDDFTLAVKLCQISGNKTPLKGIFVSPTELISTDGVRVNSFKFDSEMPTFWVEDDAVKSLVGFNELSELACEDGWVHFKGPDATIFSCRTREASEYPIAKLLEILENHEKTETDASGSLPEGLQSAIDRAGVFGTDISGLNAIKIRFTQNTVVLHSSKTAGSYEEAVELATPLSFDPELEVSVDATFIKEACAKVKEFYIRAAVEGDSASTAVLVFKGEKYTQIAMTLAV